VGPTEDPNSGWKRNDPMVQIPALVANNNAPLGVLRQRTANELGGGDVPAKFLEGLTIRTNRTFQDNYIAAGGKKRGLQLPDSGTHTWAYWGQQLQQMKPDLQRVLG